MLVGDEVDSAKFNLTIAGNPNSGKTSLFNALTGLRYKVGNYPGVTVEKKSAHIILNDNIKITLTDIPGTYSLGSLSQDEEIATKSLLGLIKNDAPPDAIIAVVDANNLERNLYFLSQLIDFKIPLIIALTMEDLAEKNGKRIHAELLSRTLDVSVVPIKPTEKSGINQLKDSILSVINSRHKSSKSLHWIKSDEIFTKLDLIKQLEDLGSDFFKQNNLSDSSPDLHAIAGTCILSENLKVPDIGKLKLEKIKAALKKHDIDPLSFEASARYKWINEIVKRVTQYTEKRNSFSARIDTALTHKYLGPLVFVSIMGFIFQSIFLWAEVPMQFIDKLVGLTGSFLLDLLPPSRFRSLVIDGVLAGVGNVIVFVPQIGILFFLLGLLEDSGYLSRAAFVMDRVMRPFGIQGRSFIPLLSSFACAIPGIMSTRSIASRSDRLTTILIAPLMSCSARLPVYTLLIAACIPELHLWGFVSLKGLTLLSMYLLGIIAAGAVSWLLKKTILGSEPALFLMEMPTIRTPMLKTVLLESWDRVATFIKNAGTIILACSVLMWALASFPTPPENIPEGESPVRYSYAGQLGIFIEPAIRPLGFNWEVGVGIIASFAAREVFVSTLATIYNLEQSETSSSLIELLSRKNRLGEFSTQSAISLMVFYVFACQCMSTLAICRKETGSWSWVALMFTYMTLLAYLMSYLTFNVLLTIFPITFKY
ncbi:MAG TPA: ferrous iron transport protein B [Oligoflexia bacterium]|nr:ferrous iron transport protein B [Oligoflexia bacterium]HMP47447.1 ferrous iron transport protein B [Oligoflexia bacterium]